MYKNPPNRSQLKLEFLDFPNPFGAKLHGDNRWVRLSRLIPWEEFEGQYAELFVDDGTVAYPFRMALGAEILKERLGVTDRELVEHIAENLYLQYFLGLPRYTLEAPFDASTLVHFRKRLSAEMLKAINERIALQGLANAAKTLQEKKETPPTPPISHEANPPDVQEGLTPPQGKLLMDATCAPEDIRFPNDLSLLNEAREVTETLVDSLWGSGPAELRHGVKPRTYRKKARIAFLNAIRSRSLSSQKLRRALRHQFRCISRNQKSIALLSRTVSLETLPDRLYRSMLVVAELDRQQRILFAMKKGERRSVPDRIVSVWKPHLRPIVRGKAGCPVEFGAKLSISVIERMSFVDRLSFDAYNESGDMIGQAVAYHSRMGFWPASIHADKIYRTRENLAWCKARGIRFSGPMLGRPPADAKVRTENRKQQRQDEVDRIPVEGRSRVAKRRYCLSRIMRRLKETSESAITMVFLVMNLDKILRDLLLRIFLWRWREARVTLKLLRLIMSQRGERMGSLMWVEKVRFGYRQLPWKKRVVSYSASPNFILNLFPGSKMRVPIFLLFLLGATMAGEVVFPPGAAVKVTDFGAVPDDGIADDTAIQAAITYSLWEAWPGTGRYVYFPDGIYDISTSLEAIRQPGKWSSGLALIGQSRAGTVIRLKDKTFTDVNNPKGMIFTAGGYSTSIHGVSGFNNSGEDSDLRIMRRAYEENTPIR